MLSWHAVVHDLRRLNDESALREFDGTERSKMVPHLSLAITGYIVVPVTMQILQKIDRFHIFDVLFPRQLFPSHCSLGSFCTPPLMPPIPNQPPLACPSCSNDYSASGLIWASSVFLSDDELWTNQGELECRKKNRPLYRYFTCDIKLQLKRLHPLDTTHLLIYLGQKLSS